jgi:hypothetical protein
MIAGGLKVELDDAEISQILEEMQAAFGQFDKREWVAWGGVDVFPRLAAEIEAEAAAEREREAEAERERERVKEEEVRLQRKQEKEEREKERKCRRGEVHKLFYEKQIDIEEMTRRGEEIDKEWGEPLNKARDEDGELVEVEKQDHETVVTTRPRRQKHKCVNHIESDEDEPEMTQMAKKKDGEERPSRTFLKVGGLVSRKCPKH